MDERQKRMARNEALFREVNESVNKAVEGLGTERHLYEYLCECANADCTFRLPLTHAIYERVRSDPTQFVVRPDHALPEIESVVEQTDDYWIVQKVGEAAAFVEYLDPRSRQGGGTTPGEDAGERS